MIIAIYGSDSYRARQYAQELQDRYRQKYPSGLNYLSFDFQQHDRITLIEALKSTSFFEEVKLLCVTNGFGTKDTAHYLFDILKEFDVKNRKDVVVMVREPKTEKELKSTHRDLFTLITTAGTTIRNAVPLTGAHLTRWVQEEVQKCDSSIDLAATHELIQRRGNDTGTLHLEILKLVNYAQKKITRTDVEKMVPNNEEFNIFSLVETLVSQKGAPGFTLLSKDLSSGRDPYYILTMLIYQVRTLVAVKDCIDRSVPPAQAAKQLMLHPFVVRKTSDLVRTYTMDQLRNLFSHLVEIEQGVKQGRRNLTDELFLLSVRGA